MSAAAVNVVESDEIRDLRHMKARAAGDLVDWLVHLELEGKADRTIYAYTRAVAPLKPAPDAEVIDSTSLTIEQVIDGVIALGRARALWT